MASAETDSALLAAVDELQNAVSQHGLRIVNMGYGVTAQDTGGAPDAR